MKKKHHPSNQTKEVIEPPDDVVGETKIDLDAPTEVADASEGAAEDHLAEMSPEQRIQCLQEKVASLEDTLLRSKAEAQNVQRRGLQQRQDAIRYANADLMKSMLSVVDDFQRSLEAASKTDNVASVVDGIKLVYENFMQAMASAGLEPIEAVNQPFDPHVHEAMLQQPSDKHEPGTVLEEITKGFKLRDRTLRPARVIVSKAVDEPSSEASTTNP